MNPQNKFVLIIQGSEPIILTEDERNFFLKEIQKSNFVQIRDYTLGKYFNCVIPYDEYLEQETYKARIKAGQWQCDYDYWHYPKEQCGHHLAARGSAVYSEFISLKEAVRLRIGEGKDERKKLREAETPAETEETKINRLEEAEQQGKDIDWYASEVLEAEA